MTAAWPTELPKPNRDSYSFQITESRLRRAQEAGPPRYRRRWSSAARSVALSIDVSRAQKSVFDDFYETDVQHGSLPFTMPDPVTDGWPMRTPEGVPVLDEMDQPILLSGTWTCLFGDELPRETLIRPLYFRIAFSVWVLP